MLLFEIVRSIFNSFQVLTSISSRRSSRRAAAILTVGPEETDLFLRLGASTPIAMIETAAPAGTRVARQRPCDGSSKLQLLWSGQHIDRKALPLLLHALASSRLRERMELHVLGAGPRTEEWQRIAQRLGLANVFWHGQLPHDKAIAAMSKADVSSTRAFERGRRTSYSRPWHKACRSCATTSPACR